jgi:hypothetical protein
VSPLADGSTEDQLELQLDHDLDCFAVVHRAVAIRHAVEGRHAIEDTTGSIVPATTSGSSSSMYARTGAARNADARIRLPRRCTPESVPQWHPTDRSDDG